MAVHRVVAGVVSFRVLLAVPGVLADGHRACRLRSRCRGLRDQRAPARVCRCAHRTCRRPRASASHCGGRVGFALDRRCADGAGRLDAPRRSARVCGRPAGEHLAGSEVARQQPGHDAHAVSRPDDAFAGQAAHRDARVRAAGSGQQHRSLDQGSVPRSPLSRLGPRVRRGACLGRWEAVLQFGARAR